MQIFPLQVIGYVRRKEFLVCSGIARAMQSNRVLLRGIKLSFAHQVKIPMRKTGSWIVDKIREDSC